MGIGRYSIALWCASTVSVGMAQQLAFPEAQGFGRFAKGARTNLSAASVYHVTNLNDSGAGSFRDAVSQPNRFVIFDVGGIINISPDAKAIVVASNVTIAGQTAPGGITIYGNKVSFSGASNTIARHFAIRKGNAGYRDDASGAANGQNMIFDHMSVTWGVDETFSLNWDGKNGSLDNITIQNSIIAQGQDRLGHSAGGLMTLPEGSRLSIIRSLFADNATRNPKVRGENEFINNVVYGFQQGGYIMGDTNGMTSHANVQGNYFIRGPQSSGHAFNSGTSKFNIYADDNYFDSNQDGVLNGTLVTSYPGANRVLTRNDFPTTPTMSAQDALPFVLENVGPNIVRDAVDTRIVNEVRSYGTLGGVIQRETDLFPNFGSDPRYLNPRARLIDSDNDGMPDNWETSRGLNQANASDWKNLAGGYTQLENYLNELGADGETILSTGGNWSDSATTWLGPAPTLADSAITVGSLTVSGGHAFARRLASGGNLAMSGGTLDVFDTATIDSTAVFSGGLSTFGRLLIGSAGKNGTLTVASGGTIQTGTIAPGGGTGQLRFDGGTYRARATPDVTVATVIDAGGATIDTNGLGGRFSGPISGIGQLAKTGSGILTLSANNKYSGGTSLSGGAIKLAHSNAAGTGPINVTSNGGIVQLANGVTVANDIATRYNFEVLDVPDANATATYAGNLTQVGSTQVRIRTTGSNATLNLTGTVNAPRGFYLSQGNIVLLGNASITGSGGAVGRGGPTNLTLRGQSNFNIGGFAIGGGQPMPSATLSVRENATLSTGSGNLNLLSTSSSTSLSTLNLDGGASTVGGFTKSSIGANQTSVINFNGGLLNYGGTSGNPDFLPVLTGLSAVVRGGGAKINDSGQSITISQPLIHDPSLAGADGGLTKSGAGVLKLTGANTYNGATQVQAGTLIVNGVNQGSGAVNVAAGAKLGGSGVIRGAVAVNSRGQLSPGNSPGILSTGNLTLQSGSELAIELTGAVAGAGYDQVDITGSVSIGGANLLLSLGYVPADGDRFFIVDNDGSDAINGRFAGLEEGASFELISSADLQRYGFKISYFGNAELSQLAGGNDVVLAFTHSIPEPSSVSLLAVVAGALLRRRRRRG